jgi:hypothetical protein
MAKMLKTSIPARVQEACNCNADIFPQSTSPRKGRRLPGAAMVLVALLFYCATYLSRSGMFLCGFDDTRSELNKSFLEELDGVHSKNGTEETSTESDSNIVPQANVDRGESQYMQVLEAPPRTPRKTTNWNIPENKPDEGKSPPFCGDPLQFEPFAKSSVTGRVLERGVNTKTFFKIARPDLIPRVNAAVSIIDKAGELDTDFACPVFDSCKTQTKKNRHSKAYLVCDEYQWIHASSILQGVAKEKLPGDLRSQGDDNVLCEIAQYLADLVANVILESLHIHGKKCIVQEQFVNQQQAGAKTNIHLHPDDTYGGLFYLEAPKGTQMCYSNSETTDQKKSWYEHAPEFTENLFPEAPGETGFEYPGYIVPQAGDFVLFPVGWMKHWVPKIQMAPGEKRTSVVFNLICI